jgi:RNA polymerase sigma factor (sigma-70 family)
VATVMSLNHITPFGLGRSPAAARAVRIVRVEPDVDAGEVYVRLAPAVLGYLRGQHVEDPEDLLGEVFYQVARSLDGFQGDDDDLRRWVFTVARNRVIDARRRAARRLRIARRAQEPETVVLPPAEPDDDLIEALAALTEDQREVIALRFVADLSLDDVAHLTGRSTNAVKAMQHRALAQLARRLKPTDGED